MRLVLIDGYVDEPTCLGVPPYISTYVRYCAGAAVCAGAGLPDYIGIDDLRKKDFLLNGEYTDAVIVAGNPVPGKYLGGLPVSEEEIRRIAKANPSVRFMLGGPIQFQIGRAGGQNLLVVNKDIEQYIYDHFKSGSETGSYRDPALLEDFAVKGAPIVQKHPRFPDVIAEIETGRGCPRKTHCSFCIEGNFRVEFREPGAVVREMTELSNAGLKHFRIGKQADLYAYGSEMKEWRNGFPKPRPEWIRKLYEGIRSNIPDILTLHLDNVNPGTLANFPDESAEITDIIASNNTPGDVAALGMESADPEVIRRNFLKAGPEDVRKAVEIINRHGGQRTDGIPRLLPGINIIHGLAGESRDTFRLNYEFLKSLNDEGLLLRRINIRQIRITDNTAIAREERSSAKERMKLDAAFRKYREMIRDDIDVPMIRRIFPEGTFLKDLIVETRRGDWSIARSLGSYSIAVNIPKLLPPLSKTDAFVIGFRERSLVALPHPFYLKGASLLELKQIPGLSKKAGEIMASRTNDPEALSQSPVFGAIRPFIK